MSVSFTLVQVAHSKLRGLSERVWGGYVQWKLFTSGLTSAHTITTYTSRRELQTLYRLAASCPPACSAVEIGSYYGASSCYIAAALAERRSQLLCIDTWENETMPEGTQKTYEQFQRNIAPVSHLVTTLRRRSDSLCASDLPRAIDFAFIDGDHRYEAARADFQLIEPLITDRGMIALHDYRWFSGVTRVVGEALASGRWILEGKVENLCWLARPVGQRSS